MKKAPKDRDSTHWINKDGTVSCHAECAEETQRRLARLNAENIRRGQAYGIQDAAEIARLKEENAQLREELAATDAEVKKIVDSREAALDEVERLREAIKGLYRSRKILDREGTWILISFDTGDWDRFVEIVREEQ